jgi:hypothetical protein
MSKSILHQLKKLNKKYTSRSTHFYANVSSNKSPYIQLSFSQNQFIRNQFFVGAQQYRTETVNYYVPEKEQL